MKENEIEMFQALMKTSKGYVAVLSDNSLDRDHEIIGEAALNKVIKNQEGKVPILLNHENIIENLIGEWVNRRMETRNGHKALVAEPKFYMSNPKAKMIKGLLDDGAECGISVGATVNNKETQKINGVDTTVYTDIELLEASFVAIPSNRHGAAMAVAKSFIKNKEEKTMGEEVPVENLPTEPKVEEPKVEEPKVEEPKVEEPVKEEDKSALTELQKRIDAQDVKIAEQIVELDKLKSQPLNKGDLGTTENTVEDLSELSKGKLPIIKR